MPVFDVTSAIARSESIYDRNRNRKLLALRDWLVEHVGPYYGPGEDRTTVHEEELNYHRKDSAVLYIGSGWQIEREWKGDPNGYMESWWKVDITDEAKAVLFALKWVR